MKKTLIFAIAAAGLSFATASADDKTYTHCAISPASQLAFIDTFKTPAECESACKETDGCTAWNFTPHSFDKDMPGQCKLIDNIFKEEESAKAFCGKI